MPGDGVTSAPIPPLSTLPTHQPQAGPQRSRMLASLYKDERSSRLDVFPFLEKVYLERILGRFEFVRV